MVVVVVVVVVVGVVVEVVVVVVVGAVVVGQEHAAVGVVPSAKDAFLQVLDLLEQNDEFNSFSDDDEASEQGDFQTPQDICLRACNSVSGRFVHSCIDAS